MFGSNAYGKLGIKSQEKKVAMPTLVELDGVVDMDLGNSHAGAVLENGALYMWGRNQTGQLGIGTKSDKKVKYKPTLVEFDEEVAQVSCSWGEAHSHSLLRTKSGHVYGFGDGYKYQISQPEMLECYTTPQPIQLDDDIVVTNVQAGGIHSCLMDIDGNLYTWGCGSDGRMGHPESKNARVS
eukprot:TRINITY_DN881_c0_g1_i4.p2 TRINITY_DN881_c0_g1~~TRINITY_DN881_c0_g1_i4.p2  ORF type:complete len:182 (+),score=52.39 TRINITY_DN881_c0_g1_i4:623-1168(+)